MLLYEQHIPKGAQDGAPLLVLLHGRGSHMGDLMGLQPHLPQDALVITPQAPFSGEEWGYGGWAWYRFLGRNRPEPSSFEASLMALDEFLRDLPGLLPVRPGPLTLGGFSQGGAMSMAYAVSRVGQVPNCLNFSGFFPDHPAVRATADTVRGTRFFWGHGLQDPMIPHALAVEGRRLLAEAGADLTTGDYPIGHWVDGAELRDAVRWLAAGL